MKALLVVDLQNDFCPQGALGILDGDKIIPTINYSEAAPALNSKILCL